MWYNAGNVIEGIETSQSINKTGSQEQGTKADRVAGFMHGYVIEPIKEGAKAFIKEILPEEIKPVLSAEGQKRPETIFVPINQERPTTTPNIDSKVSPMAAPVSKLEQMDRMQSQARINEIRRELRQA